MKKGLVCRALGHIRVGYLLTALTMGYLMTGCITYVGQYDPSVPLIEQATLRIHSSLTLEAVNNAAYSVSNMSEVLINFPAGEYTFIFDYSEKSGDSTYTASNLTASVTFKPGYEYAAIPRFHHLGSSVSVDIVESKSRQPRDTFSAFESRFGLRLGAAFINLVEDEQTSVSFDMSGELQFGQVFDGKTIQGWHIYLGMELMPLFDNALTFYSGGAYEYYFPNSGMGFGIGGALHYRSDKIFGLNEDDNFMIYPSARLELLLRGQSIIGLYGEYRLMNNPIVGERSYGRRVGNTIALGLLIK